MLTAMTTTSDRSVVPYSALERVTPDRATQLLATMSENRNLRQPVVDAYCRDLVAGRWLIAESIKLDRDGHLIDGQHRLSAIIQTGEAIDTFVTYNLDPAAKDVIDTNAVRKTGDVLRMAGYQNTTTLAATLRIGVLVELGMIRDSGGLKTGGGQYRQTHAQELAFLESYPEIATIVDTYTQAARKVKMATSSYTYGAWVLTRLDESAFEEFSSAMTQRATDGYGDARLALLDYCESAKDQGQRVGVGEALFALYTAWNAWRDDTTLRKISPFSNGKSSPRPIPVPH